MTRSLEKIDGKWVHRPMWKCVVNAFLRWAQFDDTKPLLVASKFDGEGDKAKFLGYTIQRVEVL
jgi:hypothetical protein